MCSYVGMIQCTTKLYFVRFIRKPFHRWLPLYVLLLMTGHTRVTAAISQSPLQEAILTNSTVAENQPIGTEVGFFAPASASYTLVAGSADNQLFEIIGQQLMTADTLNFEEKNTLTVLVNVIFNVPSGDSLAPAQVFIITVADSNDPPIITGQVPLATQQDTPITLELADFTVEDEDATDTYPSGFSLQALNGNNYSLSGLTTIVPSQEFSGTLTVPITANDGESTSAAYNTIVVVEARKTPTFTLAQAVYAVDEDFVEPERVVVEPDDPTQQVTYEIFPEEVDFAMLTADNSGGVYEFSARSDKNGEEEFTIKATNEQNNFFERVFTFRVNPVNDPPSFAGAADNDQRIEVGSPAVSIANFVTDVTPGPAGATDEASQTLAFQLTTTNPGLFAQPPVITPQGTLTYQPVDDQIGTSEVNAVLTDDGSSQLPNSNVSNPQQFNIEVFAPESTQDFNITNLTVAENKPAGEVVGSFTESGNYRLDGGANERFFTVSGRSLVTAQPLDFKNPNQSTLEVRIQRRYGFLNSRRESKTFTVTVTNEEEPPTGIALSNASIAEGSASGTPVGILSAQGGPPQVPVSFALVNGPEGENNGQFTIVGNELRVNVVPDRETTPQYNVLVQATGDGVSAPQPFVITVTNVAEPPTDILLTSTEVAEGAEVGRTVGTLSAQGGASAVVTYSLSGPDAAAFAVNGDVLVTNAPLNFEGKPSYALTITATGDGTLSKDFVITVANVVEPPTDILLSSNTVAEGAETGTNVGTLSAIGGEPATLFELVGGVGADNNGSFLIDEGVLKTSTVFDFETKNSYTIRVKATGDGSLEKVFIITITDQPDPPNNIQLTSTTVSENREAGTVVGRLSASGGEGPYRFRLAGNQANNERFTIEENELRTAEPFNFEATPTLEIVVQAINDDGRFDKPFTITVQNEAEPPTDIILSSNTIQENQPGGTVVGVLSATRGGSAPTFQLVGGEGSRDNNRFTIEGNQLKSQSPFNFEAQQAYSIRIRATADGTLTEIFAISVTNVPEPPTEIRLSSTTIRENQPVGSVVGDLSAVGGAGNITFALVGNNNDNDQFRIENRRLLTDAEFDEETRDTYRVRIRATGDGSTVSNFTITIENIDEAPVLSQIESTFLEYAEGDEAKSITESLEVRDPDSEELVSAVVAFANNTYVKGEDELTLTGIDVPFEWNADQGRLTVRGPINLTRMQNALRAVRYNNLKVINPTATTRRVLFRVSDGTNTSDPQERFIRVSNSNIPPTLTDIVLSTNEDNAIDVTRDNFASAYGGDEDGTGFSGSIFVLTLPDRGSLTVGERTLTDDDIGRQGFEVDFDGNATLEYTPQENYAGTDSFQWTARDDQDEPGIAAEVTINVLPINDPPLLVAPPTLNVEENTEDPLSGISVSEPDNDSVLVTLSVDRGTLTLAESIRSGIALESGTGADDTEIAFWGTADITNEVLASLFYNPEEGSATLTISVIDSPGNTGEPLTAEATVALVVIPQNDDPILTAINPDTLFFTENSAPLIIADSIQVSDEEGDAIVAAVIAIDSGYTADDLLLFENTETISATQAEGALTLTGNASVAAYQEALRSVAFQNTSDQPITAPRTLRFEVTDATGGRSNTLSRVLTIIAVEDTLQVVAIEPEPLYFAIGSTPAVVSRTVRLDDPDSETIDRIVVSLTEETYAADDDSLGSRPVGSIVSDWDPATGTLTLEGTATLAEYEQSLRTLTYFNRNAEALESSRLLQIQGFSGDIASNIAIREIQIINNIPPVVTDINIVVLSGSPYTFTASLFLAQYSDSDNRPSTDGFTTVLVTSLPRNGTLLLERNPRNSIRH